MGRVAIVIAAMSCACASRPPAARGDVETGECRTDDDCPSGRRCAQSRAHLRARTGDIVGDSVYYWCEPSEPGSAGS